MVLFYPQYQDFAEETVISRALVAWKRTPIITKNFFTASILLTLYGWLFNNNHWPSFLDLQWKKTIFNFQVVIVMQRSVTGSSVSSS